MDFNSCQKAVNFNKFIAYERIHSFFYKHMNFLAWAFAKHILCLFFSTKAFMCYVLNFCLIFLKLKPSCAYSAKWITLKKALCACDVLIVQYVQKMSLHVLKRPCAYKKNECNSQTYPTRMYRTWKNQKKYLAENLGINLTQPYATKTWK